MGPGGHPGHRVGGTGARGTGSRGTRSDEATLREVIEALAPIERRAGISAVVFRPGDALPGGAEALPSGRATEVVFWLPAHAAVVPGDVLLGDAGGGVRLCPESWLPSGVAHAELRTALAPLLDLPVERVLVSHGAPVLEDGRNALAKALAA